MATKAPKKVEQVAPGQRIRIKLKAYDNKIIDKSAKQIVETIDGNSEVHGQPIALHRQEFPRTVRDAHAQATHRYYPADPKDY